MLRRQNFRGRHQRDLVAVLDGDDRSLERDDRLAGADVALQQAAHGRRLGHVGGNLLQHALLRSRGMKRQNALDGGAHAIVDLRRRCRSGRASCGASSSRPSSRKNSSSKISRMCAGVRAACNFVRLSPTSGQCACQKARRRSISCMRPRTAAGIASGISGSRFSSMPWMTRRNQRVVRRPLPAAS